MKSKFFVLVALGALSAHSAAILDEKSRELLEKCMAKTLNVNVRAIVLQKNRMTGAMRQVKVEQSKAGVSKVTVLAPLGEQGIEYLDDGTKMTTFFPDSKTIVVKDSQRRRETSIKRLVGIAERNYELTSDRVASIAGRPVIAVFAKAKNPEMPNRRFFIDADTGYLLRLEIAAPNADVNRIFDTLSVGYPAQVSSELAEIRVPEARILSYRNETRTIASTEREANLAVTLPFGFVMQGTETICEQGDSIAIRITDGLARATIYQWKPAAGEARMSGRDRSSADRGEYRLMVVGDLAEPIRQRILDALTASSRPFGPLSQKGLSTYGTFRTVAVVRND